MRQRNEPRFCEQGDKFDQMDVCKLYSPELPLRIWAKVSSTNARLVKGSEIRHNVYGAGDFLLTETLLRSRMCKPPKNWSALKQDSKLIVFEGKDLDGAHLCMRMKCSIAGAMELLDWGRKGI